jgi:hypothetical protein
MKGRSAVAANAALPSGIFIRSGADLDKPPDMVAHAPIADPALILNMSYDNSPPLCDNGIIVNFDGKNRDPNSKQSKEQAKSRKEKKQRIGACKSDM